MFFSRFAGNCLYKNRKFCDLTSTNVESTLVKTVKSNKHTAGHSTTYVRVAFRETLSTSEFPKIKLN